MMLSVVPLVAVAAVVFVDLSILNSQNVQDKVAESQVIVEENNGISIVGAQTMNGTKLLDITEKLEVSIAIMEIEDILLLHYSSFWELLWQ
jgi:hypothetical protein